MKELFKITIEGINLKCGHCGNNTFWKSPTLLNSYWLTFFNLEIVGKQGVAYICDRCGLKHEFVSRKGTYKNSEVLQIEN